MSNTMIAIHSTNVWDDERPGAYEFANRKRSIIFVCPCGCGQKRTVPIKVGEKEPHSWKWDGDKESPTLEPSILVKGECGWHGFLTSGQWITV